MRCENGGVELLRVSRHHAHGNDFLICLLVEGELTTLDELLGDSGLGRADLAQAVCDRTTGLGSEQAHDHARGADGFIIGVDRGPELPVRMHLLNSDGSFAETSGNGLACLAHAAVDAGVVDTGRVEFETDAGLQWCDIAQNRQSMTAPAMPDPQAVGGSRGIGVAMRAVASGPELSNALSAQIEADFGEELLRCATGDVGNPHLVIALHGPIGSERTAELGAAYEQRFSNGINVEFIWVYCAPCTPEAVPEIEMSVWERGAGLTKACGTGSVVAATFARDWGMTTAGESVEIAASGYQYSVDLGPEPWLWVTAERVEADLAFPLSELTRLRR